MIGAASQPGFKIIWAAALLVLCVACSKKDEADRVTDNIIFSVNDSRVSRDEFFFYLNNNYRDILKDQDDFLLSRILDEYIISRMIVLYLKEKNMHPTTEEINEYLKLMGKDKMLTNYNLNEKRWIALHTSFILAEEKFRNLAHKQLAPVTNEEISRYYESNISEFLVEKTYCFTRFYSYQKDLMEEARNWLVRKKRDADFVAIRYQDIAVEKNNCFEETELPENFLEVLGALKKKKYSEIIESDYGKVVAYNMFQLTDVNPAYKKPLEEVSPVIEKKLLAAKAAEQENNLKNTLLKKYKVTIYPENLLVFHYNGRFGVSNMEEK